VDVDNKNELIIIGFFGNQILTSPYPTMVAPFS